MRISYLSSDVCSSDLEGNFRGMPVEAGFKSTAVSSKPAHHATHRLAPAVRSGADRHRAMHLLANAMSVKPAEQVSHVRKADIGFGLRRLVHPRDRRLRNAVDRKRTRLNSSH